MVHSFYNLNSNQRRPLLQPRLSSMTISTSILNIGYHPTGGSKSEKDKEPTDNDAYRAAFGNKTDTKQEFTGLGIDFTISHSYNETRDSGKPVKTQWLNFGTQFQPTAKWRVSYDCRYNIIAKTIESQQVNIGRDLHCWKRHSYGYRRDTRRDIICGSALKPNRILRLRNRRRCWPQLLIDNFVIVFEKNSILSQKATIILLYACRTPNIPNGGKAVNNNT